MIELVRKGGRFKDEVTQVYYDSKGNKYFQDERINSITKGKFYDKYPNEKEAKIVECTFSSKYKENTIIKHKDWYIIQLMVNDDTTFYKRGNPFITQYSDRYSEKRQWKPGYEYYYEKVKAEIK